MAWTSSARSGGQTPENCIGDVMPRAALFRTVLQGTVLQTLIELR
jgi:hypothetical protein